MTTFGSTHRREPHLLCPITGFPVPFSKIVWSRIHGRWVSPEALDDRGYKQTEDHVVQPSILHKKRRTREKPDPLTGE